MTDEHPPARNRWPRFSLRGLLGTAIVAAPAISHVSTSMKLRDARRNLEALRDEVGYLTIGDSRLVHLVAVPSAADREYRWRIYLPPGNELSFMTAVSQIPDRGLTDLRQSMLNDRPFEAGQYGQEFILTVAIVRSQHGGWQFSWDDGVRNLTIPLPQDEYSFLDERAGAGHYVAGTRGTESFPPDEPIVLFKFRKSKVLPSGAVTVDTDPCPGILVWIEKRS